MEWKTMSMTTIQIIKTIKVMANEGEEIPRVRQRERDDVQGGELQDKARHVTGLGFHLWRMQEI